MVDNLQLIKRFVIGMGLVLFLGFAILLFVAFSKLSKANSGCKDSKIEVVGKILDFIPVSDRAVGVVSSHESQNILTIYDYCSGKAKKKIYFTEVE